MAKVYALTGAGDIIIVNSLTNEIVDRIQGRGKIGTQDLALTPNAKHFYVTDYGRSFVSLVDINSKKVLKQISTGLNPVGVLVTPNGNRVWVANSGSNTVSVINTYTNTVRHTIKVGKEPIFLAITPDGKFVYVTNSGSNTVSVIRTLTKKVVATIKVGQSPKDIAIIPNAKRAYVANTKLGISRKAFISVIDTKTNKDCS